MPGLSLQELVQVLGQASFVPITFLHLHGRFFLVTHLHDFSLSRFFKLEPISAITATGNGCGAGCGDDRADIILAACFPDRYAPISKVRTENVRGFNSKMNANFVNPYDEFLFKNISSTRATHHGWEQKNYRDKLHRQRRYDCFEQVCTLLWFVAVSVYTTFTSSPVVSMVVTREFQ